MGFIPLSKANSAGIRYSVPWSSRIFTLAPAPAPSAKFLAGAFKPNSGDNSRLQQARAIMYTRGATKGGKKKSR